jgi:hypothetical protein
MATENHISSINYNDYVFRRYGKLMKFFDRKLSKFVIYMKKAIVFVSLIWFVISVFLGNKIEQQIKKETLLSSESSPIQQAKDILDYRIWKEDNFMNLNIIFGVQSDLYEPKGEESSFWDRKNNGLPVFDANFDLSPERN